MPRKKIQATTDVALKLVPPGNPDVLAKTDAPKQAGLVKLSSTLMAEMAALGVELKGAGVIPTDLGCAFVTKEVVIECAKQLKDSIADADKEEIHEIVSSVAKLSKALNLLASKNFTVVDQKPDKPQVPRRSFAPGQKVEFHEHKHVHYEKPAPV